MYYVVTHSCCNPRRYAEPGIFCDIHYTDFTELVSVTTVSRAGLRTGKVHLNYNGMHMTHWDYAKLRTGGRSYRKFPPLLFRFPLTNRPRRRCER